MARGSLSIIFLNFFCFVYFTEDQKWLCNREPILASHYDTKSGLIPSRVGEIKSGFAIEYQY